MQKTNLKKHFLQEPDFHFEISGKFIIDQRLQGVSEINMLSLKSFKNPILTLSKKNLKIFSLNL